ncbi:hypothetical protein ACHAXT_000001 [Thalassiosira profunda]
MYHPPSRLRQRHPLLLGTAALSLLASALPSAAFAASTGSSSLGLHPWARPWLLRGGQQSSTARNMSSDKRHSQAPPELDVSPFARPCKKVTVVGGTHGNEYTGVWCIKTIEKQREMHKEKLAKDKGGRSGDEDNVNVFERFPSLDIDTLLANPLAHMENKRFIDVDLNREFSQEKLLRVNPIDETQTGECDLRTEFCSDGDVNAAETLVSLPHEAVRAREIESLLGPKFAPGSTSSTDDDSQAESNTCVVIDLHTTTTNMGISLIVPEGDALIAAAAAYVLHKCRAKYGESEAQCLVHAMPKRQDRMNLSSCGRHGFTIEVGPTPQGVLRHDCVEKTETALHALLEFLHLRNLEIENGNDDGSSSILDQLSEIYPGGIVPCYRSAPAVRPGELSGKISWPNCPTNPNFPALMVHKSVQDRDFAPLRVGDPLFVQLDGTVIPYDGSHGEEVHLIFVNEGGYYYASSGTGIGVAVKSKFDWSTGWFVVESDDDESVLEKVVLEEKDSYE